MNSFKIHNSMLKRGLYLGIVPEAGAARNGSTLLNLDHDLDILPEAGRGIGLAHLITNGHVRTGDHSSPRSASASPDAPRRWR